MKLPALHRTACLVALAMSVLAGSAAALPSGRSWTPMDTTKVPGHTWLLATRLDLDPDGLPLVFATGVGGIGSEELALSWRESDWELVQRLGFHTTLFNGVTSTDHRNALMWQTFDGVSVPGVPFPAAYLVFAEFRDGQYVDIDTIAAVVNRTSFTFAGATSATRRWAMKSDGPYGLRAWYSDTARVWHHRYLPGGGGSGVAAVALDDTSALMAWIDLGAPIRWGIFRGSEWEDHGSIPGDVFLLCQATRFRPSPSGAVWLVWSTDREFIQYAVYRNGSWSLPDSISAPKLSPGRYYSKNIRPSRDRWEHPVITWVEHDATRGFLGTLCVSVPIDGQYPAGENLPDTEDAALADAVRDSLGDVWLVWVRSNNGMFWTHSYVRSTVTNIGLVDRGRRRTLAFALDEPAPDSWWTILRARDDGPYESAGRVQAGEGLGLAWTDDSPPRGRLRYKVRRDCLDARYQWESDEVTWPPGAVRRPDDRGARDAPRAPGLKAPVRPFGQWALLELAYAAPGRFEVALFDLQGRRVFSADVESDARGQLQFSLAGASPPVVPGVYFARVRDADGLWSEAVRVVVLR